MHKKPTYKALGASLKKYNDLYNFAPIGYFIVNKYGHINEVNPAGEDLFGLKREHLLKRRFSEFVSPEYQKAYHLYAKRVLGTSSNHSYETKFVKKDGISFYGRLESIAVQDNTGRRNGWRIAIVNITDSKEAEKALAESREELNSIIKSIPDIVYRLDKKNCISFISDYILQFGYSPKNLIGTDIFDIIHPEDREIAFHRINERRTGCRSTKSLELRLLVTIPVGVNFVVFCISAEGIYSSKNPTSTTFRGTQGIARDMTDEILTKRELLQQGKIQGAQETAGAVCHEMNQPLMAMLGYSEIALMNMVENDPGRDKILSIKKQIDRMKSITEKLITIKKYEIKDYAGIGNILDIDRSSPEDIDSDLREDEQ